MSLPPQVIGCGGRRQGCLGGTQIGIPNVLPPIDISDTNIAPTTIANAGLNYNYNRLHKVGVIQKIFGNENQVYPLYSRRDPYNRNRYQYFTVLGPLNQMLPVVTKSPNDELGTNESVRIQGNTGVYRTTIYDNNYPRYTPTLY
jgi:rRNA processing protein Gar1